MMTKKTLLIELENKNIPKDLYCLDGGLPNEAYCLYNDNEIWEVYYSERGIKSGLKIFNSENDACNYFLNQISEIY